MYQPLSRGMNRALCLHCLQRFDQFDQRDEQSASPSRALARMEHSASSVGGGRWRLGGLASSKTRRLLGRRGGGSSQSLFFGALVGCHVTISRVTTSRSDKPLLAQPGALPFFGLGVCCACILSQMDPSLLRGWDDAAYTLSVIPQSRFCF